jgi:8-amino-7-oxononanoate synthase
MDRMDHASIIDAVRTSNAQFHTYRRDNLERLEKYLSDSQYCCKYIVTESIFSMDGDTADLKALVELKNKYNAILIVDEAHAVGCMGERGAGLAEERDVLNEVDIVVAPLGKGPACGGAIVAAGKVVIEYLINKARPFIFTAIRPPTVPAGTERLRISVQCEHTSQHLTGLCEALRQGLFA